MAEEEEAAAAEEARRVIKQALADVRGGAGSQQISIRSYHAWPGNLDDASSAAERVLPWQIVRQGAGAR